MSEGIEVSILKLACSSHASVQCCILEMRARLKGLGEAEGKAFDPNLSERKIQAGSLVFAIVYTQSPACLQHAT